MDNIKILNAVRKLIPGLRIDVDKLKDDTIPKIEDDMSYLKYHITPEMFGAKGDSVTDDSDALQQAFTYSKENGVTVMLYDKRYYTTQSLDAGGAIIRSLSGRPGCADPYLLKKPDGTYMKGSPTWRYYFNTDTSITWREMIDGTCEGCCIISDKNIDILKIKNWTSFDIEGVAIIGNHKATSQRGMADEVPEKYMGNHQHIKDVKVIGCGNNGIHLNRGFEVSVIENVDCSYNNGHGLFVGKNNFDSATEYLDFLNSRFSYNRLDGIHLSRARKAINATNCYLNGNGQYHAAAIDPVLGYDRRMPITKSSMKAGIRIDEGAGSEANEDLHCVTLKKCFGEEVAIGVSIQNTTGRGVVSGLDFSGCQFYPYSSSYVTSGASCCSFYINVNYISQCCILRNYSHNMDDIVLEKMPYLGDNIILPTNVIGWKTAQSISSYENIESDKRVYCNNLMFKNYGDGTAKTMTSAVIKDDFTMTTGTNMSNKVAMYMLSAHFQGTQNKNIGGYLLMVTIMPSGVYSMINMPMSSTSGFNGVPTITDTGTLTWSTAEYYRYSLTRLDMGKTV